MRDATELSGLELLSGAAEANQELPILIEKASASQLWGRPV